jgi:peptide/nickel transport system substrate-binding protein
VVYSEGTLRIAYDQPWSSYEPTLSNVSDRAYASNIYETLVAFDRDFNFKPGLAVSWGMLDETTWQFKLRPNVMFHDGSAFTAEDVAASFERASDHSDSGSQYLVSTLEDWQIVDDYTLQLTTSRPDPTLLNKFTQLFIVPAELGESVPTPIGTGPYAFSRQVGEAEWVLARFDDYWGDLPAYPAVSLQSVPEKFDRYQAFLNEEIDVLAQVPPVFVDPLLSLDYSIASLPTLEVSMLLFGDDASSPLRLHSIREAIRLALDPNALMKFTSDYAQPASQFVSRGVLGYEPDLDVIDVDLEAASQMVTDYGRAVTITLDLPEGFEEFGAYVESRLDLIGIDLTVAYHASADYADWVSSGQSDFYFFGWRNTSGDATDFFTNVVHSYDAEAGYGAHNPGHYDSDILDQWVEEADEQVLEVSRVKQLKDLMTYVVEESVLGIPLFESDSLVAIQPGLDWEPRLDNLILASDFK